MTGRIGHDKAPFLGRKKPIGHINRDALFALGRQTVDKQRKIQAFTLGAKFLGVGFKRLQLVAQNHLCFIKQTTDEG